MHRTVGFGIAGGQGHRGHGERCVPEEVPMAFRVNCSDYAVMLASPADIEDFVHGFLRSEGLVRDPADITGLRIGALPEGLVLRITLREGIAADAARAERRVAGATGCGLCGVESLRDAIKPMPWLPDGPVIAPAAIRRAVAMLGGWQPGNDVSGALHAAAFADPGGRIRLSREDVGRHNALDKLLGALSRASMDSADGFVLMTSRCSFELVQKAARCGVRVLCTMSTPTALAVRLAHRANLSLVQAGRRGDLLLLAGEPRVGT
ncbi:MAG TPA: formate dehydrogenase accessory sulfurtransferase FdhD [Gammaproteobacteria bacterium]|nr:formate dehydrogenase accessory sulfurtransferase FdhD [Gammaproteobacteria bacterium]